MKHTFRKLLSLLLALSLILSCVCVQTFAAEEAADDPESLVESLAAMLRQTEDDPLAPMAADDPALSDANAAVARFRAQLAPDMETPFDTDAYEALIDSLRGDDEASMGMASAAQTPDPDALHERYREQLTPDAQSPFEPDTDAYEALADSLRSDDEASVSMASAAQALDPDALHDRYREQLAAHETGNSDTLSPMASSNAFNYVKNLVMNKGSYKSSSSAPYYSYSFYSDYSSGSGYFYYSVDYTPSKNSIDFTLLNNDSPYNYFIMVTIPSTFSTPYTAGVIYAYSSGGIIAQGTAYITPSAFDQNTTVSFSGYTGSSGYRTNLAGLLAAGIGLCLTAANVKVMNPTYSIGDFGFTRLAAPKDTGGTTGGGTTGKSSKAFNYVKNLAMTKGSYKSSSSAPYYSYRFYTDYDDGAYYYFYVDYTPSRDTVEIYMLMEESPYDFFFMVTIPSTFSTPYSASALYSYSISGNSVAEGTAYITPSTFTQSTTISFTSYSGPSSSRASFANVFASGLGLCLTAANIKVMNPTYSIGDLGFTSIAAPKDTGGTTGGGGGTTGGGTTGKSSNAFNYVKNLVMNKGSYKSSSSAPYYSYSFYSDYSSGGGYYYYSVDYTPSKNSIDFTLLNNDSPYNYFFMVTIPSTFSTPYTAGVIYAYSSDSIIAQGTAYITPSTFDQNTTVSFSGYTGSSGYRTNLAGLLAAGIGLCLTAANVKVMNPTYSIGDFGFTRLAAPKDTGGTTGGGTTTCAHTNTKRTITKAVAGSKDGKIVTTCKDCDERLSTDTFAYPKTVQLSQDKYEYSGVACEPSVTVYDSDGDLVGSEHYTVSYKNNNSDGIGAVTVTFKGDYYSGSLTKTFTITKGICTHEETTTKVTKATAGKKEGKIVTTCKDKDCKESWSESIAYPESVLLSQDEYEYSGVACEPSVTVFDSDGELISSEFYTVTYKNNNKLGDKATVTVTFKGDYYSGKLSEYFSIRGKSLTDCDITLEYETASATGKQLKPKVTVYDGDNLVKSSEYTVKYGANKTGTGTVTVTGKKNYCDSVELTFDIVTPDLSDCTLLLAGVEPDGSMNSKGKQLKPKVTVYDENGVAVSSSSYSVSYGENKTAGEDAGSVTVTAKPGKPLTGSQTVTFTINPMAQTIKISKRDITVKLGKSGKLSVSGAKTALEFDIADTSVISAVSAKGAMTVAGVGETDITVYAPASGAYADSNSITVHVTVTAK